MNLIIILCSVYS